MREEQKHALVSLAVVAGAAVCGLRWGRRWARADAERSTVAMRAKVVANAPKGAEVIDADADVFTRVPAARGVVRRARRTAGPGEWAEGVVEGADAWNIVDVLHEELPYYRTATRGDDEGVYLDHDGYTFVLDAVGWTRADE